MRLKEFASAEDQMALWRLIDQSVWDAIDQQARQEAQRKAAEQARKRLRPGRAAKNSPAAQRKPARQPKVQPKNPPASAEKAGQVAQQATTAELGTTKSAPLTGAASVPKATATGFAQQLPSTQPSQQLAHTSAIAPSAEITALPRK